MLRASLIGYLELLVHINIPLPVSTRSKKGVERLKMPRMATNIKHPTFKMRENLE